MSVVCPQERRAKRLSLGGFTKTIEAGLRAEVGRPEWRGRNGEARMAGEVERIRAERRGQNGEATVGRLEDG